MNTYKVTTNFLLAKEFLVSARDISHAVDKTMLHLKTEAEACDLKDRVEIIKITEVELESGPIILG